jgi:sugar transferase EpsL
MRRSSGYLESRSRRTVDVALASAATVVLAPLLIAVALLILASDGRPVLFRQVRIGLHGRPFTVLKFRTMSAPADDVEGLLDSGARVTRVGRILRRTSLDELPSLVNILNGEMSVVGPRPLFPQHLPLYAKSHPERLLARPGLTGLAQVSGRRNLTFSQRFDRDVEYVRRASLLLDLQIILRTVITVMTDLRRPSEGGLEKVDDIGIADAIRASSGTAPELDAVARSATLKPGDDDWPALLSSSLHDVHHLPGWSVASAPLEQGEPFAVAIGTDAGSMLVPFVRRPLDGGRWDAVSP